MAASHSVQRATVLVALVASGAVVACERDRNAAAPAPTVSVSPVPVAVAPTRPAITLAARAPDAAVAVPATCTRDRVRAARVHERATLDEYIHDATRVFARMDPHAAVLGDELFAIAADVPCGYAIRYRLNGTTRGAAFRFDPDDPVPLAPVNDGAIALLFSGDVAGIGGHRAVPPGRSVRDVAALALRLIHAGTARDVYMDPADFTVRVMASPACSRDALVQLLAPDNARTLAASGVTAFRCTWREQWTSEITHDGRALAPRRRGG